MPFFGLMNTEQFNTSREKSIRRKVFHQYPNGKASLTAILSMMADEQCNDPEFTWFEERFAEQVSTIANISTTVSLYSTVNTAFTTWTTAVANFQIVKAITGTTNIYGLQLTSGGAATFRENHIVRFDTTLVAGAATREIVGRILYVDTTNDRIAFHAIQGSPSVVDFDVDLLGGQVQVIGSSAREGANTGVAGAYELPKKISNYLQIFRQPFEMTGTALKTSVEFDKSGLYKELSKKKSLEHMIELEKAMIFGRQTLYLDSDGRPVRTMGGIIEGLENWEDGTLYGNTAATVLADDNKRIIDLSLEGSDASALSDARYGGYLERIFRTGNNVGNEKLVLCGSGFLNTVNQLYKNNTVWNTNVPSTDTYGMDVVKHITPFGSIYYKTHPLFSQNASLRYSALFMDVHNLKYRYLDGRDTQLLKNRQGNGEDIRRDEWLTECGLEFRAPETHMFMSNALGVF